MKQIGQLAALSMARQMDHDVALLLLVWHPIGPYCTWPRPSLTGRILKRFGV